MTSPSNRKSNLRPDLALIADMIEPQTRVLDIGCGDGALLEYLQENKSVDARGVELSQIGVNASVARGLSVIQGDADTDLIDYPNDAFDYVVLSQTIQATRNPRQVLEELLRISHRAIVSLPNFGHWTVRTSLMFGGKMPVTKSLSDPWYSTPNIHFCTIRDFVDLCTDMESEIVQAYTLGRNGKTSAFSSKSMLTNFLGENAVFLLAR